VNGHSVVVRCISKVWTSNASVLQLQQFIYGKGDKNMENQNTYPTPVNPLDKVLGIAAAFGSIPGMVIAYFGGDVNGQRSDYLRFYCNQALVMFISYFLAIIPFIGWLWTLFVFVCNIIAVVNACQGVAKPVLFFGTLRIIA